MPNEWFLALPWAVPFLGIPRLAGTKPNLNDAAPVTGVKLSVIIPARNESAQIGTVLASVLGSTYTPLEIVVVDDRSTDDTARKVAELAAGDARLRLVPGQALPRGWYGKPWACQQGADHATGDVLVFIDADTKHHPELMARAVSMLQETKADLLTVAPRQLVVSFWERVIMPQVWVMLGIRYHPSSVNKARKPWGVIANGQFMMFPRASYAALGGHAAVRSEVVEDLAMGQRVVAQGRKLWFAIAYDLMETRMYQNLRQVVEGWSKNVFIGSRISIGENPVLRLLAPPLMALNPVFWLVPPVILAHRPGGTCTSAALSRSHRHGSVGLLLVADQFRDAGAALVRPAVSPRRPDVPVDPRAVCLAGHPARGVARPGVRRGDRPRY